MKKIIAGAFAASLIATGAFAGGMAAPVAEAPVEAAKPAGSAMAWIVPVVLLAAIAAGSKSSSTTN